MQVKLLSCGCNIVIFFMFLYKYDLIHHQILTQVPKVDEFN